MEGVLRPEARVLPDKALIPTRNLISPPPNCFTHEVISRAPFYFDTSLGATAPDGYFEPATKVTLLVDSGGGRGRVVDGKGLFVETELTGLKRL